MFNLSTLKNNLRVLTLKSTETLPIVAIFVNTGSKREKFAGQDYLEQGDLREEGISHALEHMVFKGSKTRNTKQIAQDIEKGGGMVNAYTSKEFTCYYSKFLTENLDICFDVLKDFIVNSSLMEEEWQREREVIIQEIGEYEDSEQDVIFTTADSQSFKGSGLAHSILGTRESLKQITAADLKNYLHKFYTADNIIVGIASPLDHEEIVNKVSHTQLNNLHQGLNKLNNIPVKFNPIEPMHIQKSCQEWHVLLRYQAPNFYSEDFYPLNLGINILGDGMSSRLFQSIREEAGLAYSIYASYSSYFEIGQINIYAATGYEHHNRLMELIGLEIDKICRDVTQQELEKAKNTWIVAILASNEGVFSRLEQACYQMFRYDKIISTQERITKIKQISLQQVQEVLTRHLLNKPYNLFTLGNKT